MMEEEVFWENLSVAELLHWKQDELITRTMNSMRSTITGTEVWSLLHQTVNSCTKTRSKLFKHITALCTSYMVMHSIPCHVMESLLRERKIGVYLISNDFEITHGVVSLMSGGTRSNYSLTFFVSRDLEKYLQKIKIVHTNDKNIDPIKRNIIRLMATGIPYYDPNLSKKPPKNTLRIESLEELYHIE